MKKRTLFFSILSIAGLLISVSAQTDDNTNAPSSMPPTDMSGTNSNENNAPETAPPDAGDNNMPDTANAPDANMPPPEMAPSENNGATTENNDNTGSVTILPSKKFTPRENVQSNFLPPEELGTNVDELRLNFRNAPLDEVLNYLSDAAGFIIILDTHVSGNVSVISSHPMTRDEAVDLLNSVLNKNGYAAIRDGRTLTIVDKNDAKTRDIPVKTGSDPSLIPKNDEIVTQIIPIRFVEARQLISDLTSFVSPQATVVANEAGNSIVITDTQANIRHLAQIIKAIDDSAEAETEIRVFHLKYASPTDVATELGNIFPTSGTGTQSPIRFGGRGGGGRGNFFQQMMAGNSGGDANNDRIKKATQVTAVADARIQAVIVTAPGDLMDQIAGMMKDLDVPSERDQKVYVFHMDNGDPQEALQVLQSMFQSNNNSRNSGSSSTQNSALMQRKQNNATSGGSGSTTSTGFGSSGGGGGRGGIGGNSQF